MTRPAAPPEPSPPAGVLVMARAPRPGEVRRALEPVLSPAGCAELEHELLEATVRWAHEVAPGRVHVAYEPADAGPEIHRALPGAHTIPQSGDGIAARVGDAVGRLFARPPGPVLIVWPELPRLNAVHAQAALADLREGCDLVVGPTFDGNVYLLGFTRILPQVFAIPESGWRGGRLLNALFGLSGRDGIEVGMLRPERGLRQPADVRAAVSDPLTGPRLRRILSRER